MRGRVKRIDIGCGSTIKAVIARATKRGRWESLAAPSAILIQGVACSGALEPVRFTEAMYRGDCWGFQLDTTRPAADFKPVPKGDE